MCGVGCVEILSHPKINPVTKNFDSPRYLLKSEYTLLMFSLSWVVFLLDFLKLIQ